MGNTLMEISVPLDKENFIELECDFCKNRFMLHQDVYSRIEEQDFEKSLKVAYVNEDREIFRFEHDDMLNIDDKKILWAW